MKSFNTAIRVKSNHNVNNSHLGKEQKKYTEKELELMLHDVVLVQTKWDLIHELQEKERQSRSLSPKIIAESFEI